VWFVVMQADRQRDIPHHHTSHPSRGQSSNLKKTYGESKKLRWTWKSDYHCCCYYYCWKICRCRLASDHL